MLAAIHVDLTAFGDRFGSSWTCLSPSFPLVVLRLSAGVFLLLGAVDEGDMIAQYTGNDMEYINMGIEQKGYILVTLGPSIL